MKTGENEKLKYQELQLNVYCSIRYHDRRRAFFEFMHRLSSMFMILLASLVLLDLIGRAAERPAWLTVIALMAAVLGALDIIVGFSSSAALHIDLRGRLLELEIVLLEMESITENSLQYVQTERLRIEQDEPPIYRALDVLCYNEIMRANGVTDPKEYRELKWYQSATSHLWPWANIAAARATITASK